MQIITMIIAALVLSTSWVSPTSGWSFHNYSGFPGIGNGTTNNNNNNNKLIRTRISDGFASWSYERRTIQSRRYMVDTTTTADPFGKPGGAVVVESSSSLSEPWTTPRLHNTAALRSLALLGALGATSVLQVSPALSLSTQAVVALHLFSFAATFGTNVYTTFVLGITMFQNLPRQTFGKLQAKLFPKYFGLSSIALVLQLVTVKYVKGIAANVNTHHAALWALGMALSMNMINQFLLEPISTDNMMRRYDIENDAAAGGGTNSEKYKKLKKNFGKYHGLSSLCNLISLCAGAVHGYLLAGALAL